MRGVVLLAALLGLGAPQALATTLVGTGLNRDELVRVEGLADPQTTRPFPFGASPALHSLADFSSAQRLRITTAGDRVLLVDPDTDFVYEVDPFTGEIELQIRLHVANPKPWSDPAGDFDSDGIPNGADVCPEFKGLCEGGPNPGRGCRSSAQCGAGGTCALDPHTDTDDDGVGDFCDSCPDLPNPRIDEFDRAFFRTTTGSQPDADRDGIGDACDCDFTTDGTVCASGDLERMLTAIERSVEDPDDCLDRTGNAGPCAPFDLDGLEPAVDLADLTQLVGALGTNPEPCPVCPYRCSGPACATGLLRLGIEAVVWDPIGGPVWTTPLELEDRPRIFAARSSPLAGRGLFAAHLHGPRRFILFPYAALNLTTRALAFDPYPKTPSESVHKVLYGANGLGFYAVDIQSIDLLVKDGSIALPLRKPVDPVVTLATRIGGPLDNIPVVLDEASNCGSLDVTFESESCAPEELLEAAFWIDDRCRTRTACTCAGNDCARATTNLNNCYSQRRSCSAYCSPYQVDPMGSCAPEDEVSGFIWDGDACVPFDGCCEGVDCEVVFPDLEACEFAFVIPRDPERNVYPVSPCPNYYHRPSCAPDAVAGTCAEGEGRDGFFFNGARCIEVFDFCCEGPDCPVAFIAYENPLPPLIADDPNATPEDRLRRARTFARLGCSSRQLRCSDFCAVLSEVRPTTDPADCTPDEVFVDGFIWQLVSNLAGIYRDCVKETGCCRGPDCARATDTYSQCLDNFIFCVGLNEEPLIQDFFFENAGGRRGRLIGVDDDGNLICIDPGSAGFISASFVGFPEKQLRTVAMLANFDVTQDGLVDDADVCAVEAAVQSGETFCLPVGSGDPVEGPCRPYPGGECSVTMDLNRDTKVDVADLVLIEREVGAPCQGGP